MSRPSTKEVPMTERKAKQVVMLLAKPYAVDTRVRNEAESLRLAGYDVTVLSWDRLGQGANDGVVSGVRIVSLRLLNGLEFSRFAYALSAIMLQFYCVAWCLRSIRGKYLVHANDFNTLPAGVTLRILCPSNVRLVYDCHELTPSAYAEWYGYRTGLVAGALERRLLQFADAVITVSPPIQSYLSGITRRPVSVIFNTIKIESVPVEGKAWWKKKLGLEGFVVSYVGTLRQDVGLDELIEAAAHLNESDAKGIRFLIVGYGPDLNRIRAKAANLEGLVTFVPRVSHAEALGYVRASDISYAVYRTRTSDGESDEYNRLVSGNTMVASPWKIFEAMACGTCVLVRDETYTWTLVNSLGFGISAGSGTGSEIAGSLSCAFQNKAKVESMAESARKHFSDEYNWNRMAKRLVELYEELA
jgi:glycosyltransferase involved in cell wall biosynthesis